MDGIGDKPYILGVRFTDSGLFFIDTVPLLGLLIPFHGQLLGCTCNLLRKDLLVEAEFRLRLLSIL